MEINNLFNLEETIAKELLENKIYPWECLDKIQNFILNLGPKLDTNLFQQLSDNIWIAKTANISPSACIEGPAIIDEGAELRHSAFIRGNVIVGKNAVIGNSTELKNSILFNEVQVPHFNYIGDSILGYKAHLGAGAILSNLRADGKEVIIKQNKDEHLEKSNYSYLPNLEIKTNLRKVGAFLGDCVQVGCNSVLNPGTVVGKNTIIYPLCCVKGIVGENIIYKN